MEVRFKQVGEYAQGFVKYKGDCNPQQRFQNCKERLNWEGFLKELWVHGFIHTMRTFLKSWYLQEEIRKHIGDWDSLVD